MNILEVLEIEEGYRKAPYYCSEGFVTIGIGQRIGPKGADLSWYEFTVNKDTAYAWLNQQVLEIELELAKSYWYSQLDQDKQVIIKSMCYQLGFSGLFKFKKMIDALAIGDYKLAAREALDSRWAKQTPVRAARHASVLSGKSLDSIYKM